MICNKQYLKAISIVFTLLLSTINCNLKIPLKFIQTYNNNETVPSPSSIMRNIVYAKAYAEFEIGTPKQLIQIPLSLNSNDFYIAGNAEYEFSKNPERYNNLKFFNSTNSKTCDKVEEKMYHGDNFAYGQYHKDFFYFNDKKVELEFYLPVVLNTVESGGLGLQLWPILEETTSTINDKRTFLRKIKMLGLIDEFYWSVFYNSKDYENKEGFLFLGSLPHNLNLGYYKKEYFDLNYLRNIDADIWVDYIKHIITFDEAYAFEGTNKEKKISEIKFPANNTRLCTIELNYNLGGIQVPYTFFSYFEKFFEEYISKGECFSDRFNAPEKKNYFYCKNDKNLITKIKQKFPGFNFKSVELYFNFSIVGDDLFFEKNNYVYLLMFFDSSSGSKWVMGRPFLQKYQFFINPDKKNINFYSNLDMMNKNGEKVEETNDNNKSNIFLYIIIIVSVIIIIILGFFLWKFYSEAKNIKKKRANELDDDYDYQQKKDLNGKEYSNPINE
jgi:hypothetical protein